MSKILREALWNVGVFYLLYVLYRTTQVAESEGVRIRVSVEEWTQLLLAHERMKLLPGGCCEQAVATFHKLLAVDAFQFSLFSGPPSLHRLARVTCALMTAIAHGVVGNGSCTTISLSALCADNALAASQAARLAHEAAEAGFSWKPEGATSAVAAQTTESVEWDDALRDFFGTSSGPHTAPSYHPSQHQQQQRGADMEEEGEGGGGGGGGGAVCAGGAGAAGAGSRRGDAGRPKQKQ
jgi:hypothetical protein